MDGEISARGKRNLLKVNLLEESENMAAPDSGDDDDDDDDSAGGVNLAHLSAAKRRRWRGPLPLRRNAAFPFLRPRMERGSSEREVAGYIVR